MASRSATRSKTLLADLGLTYAAAIWGSTFFLVKNALAGVDAVVMVAYRFLLAAALMGVYLKFTGRPLFDRFKGGAIIGALLFLLYVPQTVGLGFTSASNSAFITGLFVAFVPFLSLLFRLKPTSAQWGAVVLSLAGLWFLTGGLAQVNAGDVITLSAALAYAAHILIADHYVGARVDPYAFSFQQFLVVGALSLGLALLLNSPFAITTYQAGTTVVFLAFFPTLLAFVIQFKAQQITSPVKVSLIFAMEPVFAGVFAWTLGGEPFSVSKAFGGLLIFAAILASTLKN